MNTGHDGSLSTGHGKSSRCPQSEARVHPPLISWCIWGGAGTGAGKYLALQRLGDVRMEKWKWNPYMNMTGKQDGLKQRGCLKTGKSLELQDIARGGNRGRMSGRGKREREVKTGRGIGQDKDVKTAGEDGPGREIKHNPTFRAGEDFGDNPKSRFQAA